LRSCVLVPATDLDFYGSYFSAVGSTVIQIAKNVIGCKKVIGIAGGQKKCDWSVSLLYHRSGFPHLIYVYTYTGD